MSEAVPTVRLIQDPQELANLADHWRGLVDRADSSVFQTFEWQWAWWRHFGARRRLFIFSAWEPGGELVALAPWFLEPRPAGRLLAARRLRFIGSGHSDYLQVIAARSHEAASATALADALCARAEWDELYLEDVPESAEATAQLIAALRRMQCPVWRAPDHRCFSVALPSSFDAYLAELSAHRRSESLRQMRRLAAEGFAMEEVTTEPPADALDAFIVLHEQQWSTGGDRGAFSDRRVREFHHEIARIFQERDWLDLAFLARPGERLAANFDFRYKGTVYAYLGGVDLDSDWARVSPGMVLNVQCIERAIRRGDHTYDLMRGSERYKTALGATERMNWRYQVAAPRIASRLAVGAERLMGAARRSIGRVTRRSRRVLGLPARLLRTNEGRARY